MRSVRGLLLGALVVGVMLSATEVAAQPTGGANGTETAVQDDPSFGPIVFIERIDVVGNRSTAARLIRRALPVRVGNVLRAGDSRLRKARFKVLALGYFRAVELRLGRGSSRGKVVLTVRVVERGTVVLNQLHFGTSRSTPWWLGADLTERNLGGTGLGLGLGFLYASAGDIEGAGAQSAGELRLNDPAILGTQLGAHAGLFYRDAVEPYRVRGPADDATEYFDSFTYRRLGASAGLAINVTPLARLSIDARLESVDADLPSAPTRTRPDGTVTAIEIALRPDSSWVSSIALGFDRDTRANPVLPFGGDRLVVVGELSHSLLGSSYDYARVLASYEHWWPVSSDLVHVLAVKLLSGLTLGNPPLFESLHVSDVNRNITPRAFGLTMSTDTASDFLGTGADEATYGDVAASAAIEYSYRLFRKRRHVYGGDLFVGAGIWALARSEQLSARDQALLESLPASLFIDAGLRLDTEFGIFELTLANAIGRIPL